MSKARSWLGAISAWVMVLTAGVLAGCNGGVSQSGERDVQADGLFMDYQAIGYEDREEVVVRAQFRLGGPEGEVLMLDEPAVVYFDGKRMDTGSTKMTGGYYEAVFEAAADGGQVHEIHYKDASGRSFRDSFYFPFFHLAEEIPETVSRANGLQINLSGLDSIELIHAMLSDTSYYGKGIDRLDSVRLGTLNLSTRELNDLRNGPIHIEFYREREAILRRAGLLRGKLYLSYNLSREFELGE